MRYSRYTGRIWPVITGRIGNQKQRFPCIGIAIGNTVRHVDHIAIKLLLDLVGNGCCPQAEAVTQRIAFLFMPADGDTARLIRLAPAAAYE
jgi:hypothetical protein